jgi:hypothetical protein
VYFGKEGWTSKQDDAVTSKTACTGSYEAVYEGPGFFCGHIYVHVLSLGCISSAEATVAATSMFSATVRGNAGDV